MEKGLPVWQESTCRIRQRQGEGAGELPDRPRKKTVISYYVEQN